MVAASKPVFNGKSMTDAHTAIVEGVLGIDVGTTATRACIAPVDELGEYFVVGDSVEASRNDCPNTPDIGSLKSPFSIIDPLDIYLDGYGDGPFQMPVKFFLYIFRVIQGRRMGRDGQTRKEQEYRREIPQLETFFKRYDELPSNEQCEIHGYALQIFEDHLRKVRTLSEDTAEARGITITKLAPTVPSNWDGWTCDFYLLFLRKVWSHINEDQITLIYESEAIGQYVLRSDCRIRKTAPEVIMVVDFGGHTLTYNIFEPNYGADGTQFSFFTLSQDNCFYGGAELYASRIRGEIRKRIEDKKIEVAKADEHQMYKSLMNDYRVSYRSKLDGRGFTLCGNVKSQPPGSKREKIKVSKVPFGNRMAKSFYNESFTAPLNKLFKQFEGLPKDKQVLVVLTGGTFSNRHIRERVKTEINKRGFNCLYGTVSMDKSTAAVAQGAAMALIKKKSVAEFMENATFAIQNRSIYENEVPIIWSHNTTRIADIDLTVFYDDVVFICCCPCASGPIEATHIPFKNTFEFEMVDRHLRGRYRFSMKYRKENPSLGQSDALDLEIEKLRRDGSSEAITLTYPVYYDPGALAVFVDIDSHDNIQQCSEPSRYSQNPKKRTMYENWARKRRDENKRYWEEDGDIELPKPSLEAFRKDGNNNNETAAVAQGSVPQASPPGTSTLQLLSSCRRPRTASSTEGDLHYRAPKKRTGTKARGAQGLDASSAISELSTSRPPTSTTESAFVDGVRVNEMSTEASVVHVSTVESSRQRPAMSTGSVSTGANNIALTETTANESSETNSNTTIGQHQENHQTLTSSYHTARTSTEAAMESSEDPSTYRRQRKTAGAHLASLPLNLAQTSKKWEKTTNKVLNAAHAAHGTGMI